MTVESEGAFRSPKETAASEFWWYRASLRTWRFAFPLVLISLFPNQIQYVALFYFIVRLSVSAVQHLIWREWRKRVAAKHEAIAIRTISVLGLLGVMTIIEKGFETLSATGWVLAFSILVILMIADELSSCALGFAGEQEVLSMGFSVRHYNLDKVGLDLGNLAADILAPLVGGLLLCSSESVNPIAGIALVAAAYLISTNSLAHAEFESKSQDNLQRTYSIVEFRSTIKTFFNESSAGSLIAYLSLSLSVLTTQNILLSVYLQDGWKLTACQIGWFVSLGALTWAGSSRAFQFLRNLFQPLSIAFFGLAIQSVGGVAAMLIFISDFKDETAGRTLFLLSALIIQAGFVLFYLSESKLRFHGVQPRRRKKLERFRKNLTEMGTICLLGIGALIGGTSHFQTLITCAFVALLTSAFYFLVWGNKTRAVRLKRRLVY